ncbi:sugar kinase [Algivirga pacifica]|uniref:NAD(+)/NADH kinase n=1 Tax=Algivirga pacifica TaxID=1162670 RepID=A0ABP9DBM5_9BACT
MDSAIIIKSKTRLQGLIERFNTEAQARFYIEHSGGNFEAYKEEHEQYQLGLSKVQRELTHVLKSKTIDKSFLSSFIFDPKQLLVVVGQDGLVANTAKYANGAPILGVNPDTSRYDGPLLPFDTSSYMSGVEAVLSNKYTCREASLAEARLNNGQRLLAFNDLFVGASSHISARYQLQFGRQQERQSSSGIIVSTKSGATGWLSSIFNMYQGVNQYFESNLEKKQVNNPLKESELMFVVREPFASQRTGAEIVTGKIQESENRLEVTSEMPSQGVIFSDGIEHDYLSFNAGAVARIGVAEEKALLVQ